MQARCPVDRRAITARPSSRKGWREKGNDSKGLGVSPMAVSFGGGGGARVSGLLFHLARLSRLLRVLAARVDFPAFPKRRPTPCSESCAMYVSRPVSATTAPACAGTSVPRRAPIRSITARWQGRAHE